MEVDDAVCILCDGAVGGAPAQAPGSGNASNHPCASANSFRELESFLHEERGVGEIRQVLFGDA
jgi:hypothetical protein